MGAGLIMRRGLVGSRRQYSARNHVPRSQKGRDRRRGTRSAGKLQAQVAVSADAVITRIALVEVGCICGRCQQQCQHREERDELACVRTVHAAGRSVAFSALSTDRFDLDCGRFQAKPERPPPLLQGPIEQRVLDLSDATALATDEELSRVIVLRSIATQERVEGVQAVHQPRLLQELKCSIDSRRRSLLPIPAKFGKNLVRANRLMLAPHNLQNMPP